MKILDLFCGVGGSAMGYKQACPEAEIVGVDIAKQPNYPFTFVQMDIVEFFEKTDITKFDFIHASPPCLAHTTANNGAKNKGTVYADYVEIVREKLIESGVSYCIENVPQAKLKNAILLSGGMFGLKIIRKRAFECSFFIFTPPMPNQRGEVAAGKCLTAVGNGWSSYLYKYKNKGRLKGLENLSLIESRNLAMGIDWAMTKKEINNAVPPAYTAYIFENYLKQTTG